MASQETIHTILLVSNKTEDRLLIEHSLRSGMVESFELLVSSSCEDAVEVANRSRPDVILLDLPSGQDEGLATISRFRAAIPKTPFIVLAENPDRDQALAALRVGAQDYFHKTRINPDAIARVVRFGIERFRRLEAEQELEAAERVQTQLFPGKQVDIPGWDVFGATESAGKACGDYYDFLTMRDDRHALVIGDVSGHGMAAALRMVETRAYLRSIVYHESDPGEILAQLNRFMIDESSYGASHCGQFVTLMLVVLDSERDELEFATAGHYGYLLQPDGASIRLKGNGLPLGIADSDYTTSGPIRITEGDRLLLMTDGIGECMNRELEQFGDRRAIDLVYEMCECSASDIVARLTTETEQYRKFDVRKDDETVIVACRCKSVACIDNGSEDVDRSTAPLSPADHTSEPTLTAARQ